MQDYHIYAHYVEEQKVPPTSPQFVSKPSRATAVSKVVKENTERKHSAFTVNQAQAVALTSAYKINTYVGELTENIITQRKVQIGLALAGIGRLAVANPIMGAIAATAYIGNLGIQYGIRIYKTNLSAEFMRTLSGGTVKTGR